MLIVRIQNSFVPEKSYVISVLLGDFLGLPYTIEADERPDYRIELPNGSRLVVRDGFWATARPTDGYMFEELLPQRAIWFRSPFSLESEVPFVYGTDALRVADGEIYVGGDLFASAFYMLSRWEERFLDKDCHDRAVVTSCFAGREQLLDRPLVNEYVELLWGALRHLGVTVPRKQRSYELVLTHDIDVVRYNPITGVRSALARQRRLGAVTKRVGYLLGGVNPNDTFTFLMDVSEAAGLRSRFYFLAGGTSAYDVGRYTLRDTIVWRSIEQIQRRGHVIGIHASYSSFLDAPQLRKEVNQFTETLGIQPREGRQHYMRCSAPETWLAWQGAGLALDSTFGYAEREGFRCGTADEYRVFDVEQRKAMSLVERPLVAMDTTLADYRRLDALGSELTLRRLAATCMRYRMQFTVLFHNDSFDPASRPGWKTMYRRFVTQVGTAS